jgi:HK97 family phage major capsid protein
MLKQLLLTRKIAEAKKKLEEARGLDAGFLERKTALDTREEELAAALEEVTTETSEEDKAAVEAEIASHEENSKALSEEQEKHEAEKTRLNEEIEKLQSELDELNARAARPPANPTKTLERKEEPFMQNRTKFFGMTMEQRDAFMADERVKTFLSDIRSIKERGVSNASLLVPDIVLEPLRNNLEEYSKLIKFVSLKRVPGTARQNIVGAAPEGIWMEAEGELNELGMTFNQVEVDGYMVGGVIYIHNNFLKDSDFALASEVMTQLVKAIGKGVDRAILFGTGSKMPVGIATRLAQSSQPAGWGSKAPTWTDLHTSNIKKLNIDGSTGAAFYASLIAALGVAKPDYTDGKAFWVVNRATHIKLMTKALAFDAAAALLAGVNNQMPIVGGEIVVSELVGDNTIIGGYGSAYLLAEREGSSLEASEHYKFVQNQTTFKGYSRYDGLPVFGEAFVIVNFANADATTSSTFPTDWANTDIGVLGVTAAAHATSDGKTVLTVTGAEATGTTLAYKIGDYTVKNGQKVIGYTTFTSGTTGIEAAAGKIITVVELNSAGLAIKTGKAASVPKSA